MVYAVKTAKSVKMSHIFQVTIAILSDCFALHLPGHPGTNQRCLSFLADLCSHHIES